MVGFAARAAVGVVEPTIYAGMRTSRPTRAA